MWFLFSCDSDAADIFETILDPHTKLLQVLDFLSYSSLVLVDKVNIWLLESFPLDY